MKNLKLKIKEWKKYFKSFLRHIKYHKGIKRYDLLIYDDFFPNPITAFRLVEFTALLKYFKNSKIILNPFFIYKAMGFSINKFETHVNDFVKQNPDLKKRIFTFGNFININTRLFYCVFLNNIFPFIDELERKKINFAFTLFPGGGFSLNDDGVDEKLRRLLGSPQFKTVK